MASPPPAPLLGRASKFVAPRPYLAAASTVFTSRTTAIYASSGGNSSSLPSANDLPRKKKQPPHPPPPEKQRKPSVLEVQRAIGVVDSNDGDRPPGSSPIMDLLRTESSFERKIRETAEWVVETTESRALYGQKVLLVVCLKILPVWLLLLLVASGVIELPFKIPFVEDLFS